MTDRKIVASLPPLPARKPEYAALPGTTDTHFHIFESTHRYPLIPARMYDPALSTVGDYLAMAETIGIQRMVVVQASIYGTDNRCLLDSIQRLGARRTRGIAVVDQSITLDALKEMDRQGVRGIRFNAITGRTPVEWLPSLARLIEPLGWHIQLWTNSARLMEIGKVLDDVPTPIVLDHMGQFPVEEGVAGAQFQNILRRLDSGRFWVKLIGYRVSKSPSIFEDLMAPAKALMGAAPERCLWGTDWPHIFLEGRPMPNTTALFDLAWRWLSPPDPQRVFVDNPARLYGFD
ncbi:MAG: amidohydrolase family protein [Legionella sp.]|nr:amidohydrolase family protein [Legionella sp.]